jgi:hypothetical protein
MRVEIIKRELRQNSIRGAAGQAWRLGVSVNRKKQQKVVNSKADLLILEALCSDRAFKSPKDPPVDSQIRGLNREPRSGYVAFFAWYLNSLPPSLHLDALA